MGCGGSKPKRLDESNKSRLQRGMLVDVDRVHRSGNDVYKKNASNSQMYQHPSFKDPLPQHFSRRTNGPAPPQKDMKHLRAQLIRGDNQVKQRRGW
ncbi:hypothetical protein FSST1_000098 [Fusarium sambucinum]